MPPKSASKPTSQAESDLQSVEAQRKTSEPYLPVRSPPKHLSELQVEKVVGTFFWYKFHNRPLMRDEIQGMIRSEYGLTKRGTFLDNRFQILEKQVKVHGSTEYDDDIKENDPDRVSAEVDVIFDKYCNSDPNAKYRRDILMGLTVRLPHLEHPTKHPPHWGGEAIRTEQFCCLYGLANWCKTDKDDLILEIATNFIFQNRSSNHKSLDILDNLGNPEHPLARQVHKILHSHGDIESHFRNLAFRFYNEHRGRKIQDSAKDTVESTTAYFSGLNVTAGSSTQSRGTPGKATPEYYEGMWSGLHDFDTESESAESSGAGPSSRPQQITTIDPSLLDKRKERESTESSSPASGADPSEGTIGSKAKGKAPKGKRQRGSN